MTKDQEARLNAAIKEMWACAEEAGLSVLCDHDTSDDGHPQVVYTLEGEWA